MGNTAFNLAIRFVEESCCKCGVIFAIPVEIKETWQQQGKTFYCYNGHPLWYGDDEATRLKKKIKRLEEKAVWAASREKSLRNTIRAEKGAKTRLKNRISKGVCPCCKRTFVNVARHMTTKHKDWTDK